MVKFQMLLKKQWKCSKKKTNKGTNNDSWIKQRKNNNYSPKTKKKMGKNNSKLLLLRKFDFDPKEIWDKLLLLDLKKISEDNNIKIPDKDDVYYIKHRERTNTFRLRKDPKEAEKDELITILETVNRAIKRSTSKLKLSQLKQIKKQ